MPGGDAGQKSSCDGSSPTIRRYRERARLRYRQNCPFSCSTRTQRCRIWAIPLRCCRPLSRLSNSLSLSCGGTAYPGPRTAGLFRQLGNIGRNVLGVAAGDCYVHSWMRGEDGERDRFGRISVFLCDRLERRKAANWLVPGAGLVRRGGMANSAAERNACRRRRPLRSRSGRRSQRRTMRYQTTS